MSLSMFHKANVAPTVRKLGKPGKAFYIAVFTVAAFVFVFFLLPDNGNKDIPETLRGVALSTPERVTQFVLVDHNGRAIGTEQLEGYWTFLFFGFTHCPDVCPATLSQMRDVIKKIKAAQAVHQPVQVFFVSVDPARDTVEHLAAYINYFGSPFVGVTGEADAIKLLENQLGAFHRIEKSAVNGKYNIQHSAEIFLIDPQTKLSAKFRPPLSASTMVQQFSLIADRFAEQQPGRG